MPPRSRRSPADHIDRPPMPAALDHPPVEPPPAPEPGPPAPAPTRATTRRYTVDLDLDRHGQLRRWALDADVDAAQLVSGWLDLVRADPAVRVRVEQAAREIPRRRGPRPKSQ